MSSARTRVPDDVDRRRPAGESSSILVDPDIVHCPQLPPDHTADAPENGTVPRAGQGNRAGERRRISPLHTMDGVRSPVEWRCNSDAFRISETDSTQFEKVSLFYGCRGAEWQEIRAR